MNQNPIHYSIAVQRGQFNMAIAVSGEGDTLLPVSLHVDFAGQQMRLKTALPARVKRSTPMLWYKILSFSYKCHIGGFKQARANPKEKKRRPNSEFSNIFQIDQFNFSKLHTTPYQMAQYLIRNTNVALQYGRLRGACQPHGCVLFIENFKENPHQTHPPKKKTQKKFSEKQGVSPNSALATP